MSKPAVENAIASVSFVNICFLKIWGKVLLPYHVLGPMRPVLIATLLNFLLLSSIIFFTREVLRRKKYEWLLIGFDFVLLLSVAFAVEVFVVTDLKFYLSPGFIHAVPYLMLCALVLLFTGLFCHAQGPRRIVIALLLMSSPFVLVTLFRVATEVVESKSIHLNQEFDKPPYRAGSNPGVRVVWIIFDELDQRQLFGKRVDGVRLPEFDRLRMESSYSDHAFPPASYTEKSLPSLLTGRIIETAKPAVDELNVRFEGEEKTVGFSRQPGVFTDAREMGLKTAVVGWFNPYCQLLLDQLSSCYWTGNPEDWLLDNRADGIPNLMAEQMHRIITRVSKRMAGADPMTEVRAKKIRDLQTLLTRARSMAADASYGVVFVHLPVPHPPSVFSRSSAKICNCKDLTYLDDLELANQILGDFRKDMEIKGIWNSTAVIISSDHWWRSEYLRTLSTWSPQEAAFAPKTPDHRIPFLAKLPGQTSSFEIKTEFNTVITRGMISEIITGRVRTPQHLSDWIEQHNRTAELSNYDKLEGQ